MVKGFVVDGKEKTPAGPRGAESGYSVLSAPREYRGRYDARTALRYREARFVEAPPPIFT